MKKCGGLQQKIHIKSKKCRSSMILCICKSTLSGDSCDVFYIDVHEVRSMFHIDLFDNLQKTRKTRCTEYLHRTRNHQQHKHHPPLLPFNTHDWSSSQMLHGKFFNKDVPILEDYIIAHLMRRQFAFSVIVLSILLIFQY